MRLTTLMEASAAVADTRSRLAKRSIIADTLTAAAAESDPPGPSTLELAATLLAGELRQRRTGVGWRRLADLPPPAEEPSLTLIGVDTLLQRLADTAGAGSQAVRAQILHHLMAAATTAEQDYLRRLITGNLRQGAQDSLMLDSIAQAFVVPVEAIRRAAFLGGSTAAVALAAAQQARTGEDVLAGFRVQVGRPVRPMLASSAPDIPAAMETFAAGPVMVDTKLDGIRIQVHRHGDSIQLFSRSLDDVTAQFPDVVTAVSQLPATALILDGEVLAMRDGRPQPFQVSASRGQAMSLYVFDALHVDGRDLVDEPAAIRWEVLESVVPAHQLVMRAPAADATQAQRVFESALQAGHEGVVLKDLQAPYAAGRRGAAWVKVKPRHTFDLVVLAVERGSGRRRGHLSNIHLGARDEDTGELVMVGKTFKGMTDEILAWQTRRFTELATGEDGYVVNLRPEQVVEVAIDGIQRSTRYPGGLALRFARVVRYREDRSPDQADTLQMLRTLHPDGDGAAPAEPGRP